MKINAPKSIGFKPVTIELTFESQEELNRFHDLLNYCRIVEWLLPGSSSGEREELRTNLRNIGAVSNPETWESLKRTIKQ